MSSVRLATFHTVEYKTRQPITIMVDWVKQFYPLNPDGSGGYEVTQRFGVGPTHSLGQFKNWEPALTRATARFRNQLRESDKLHQQFMSALRKEK